MLTITERLSIPLHEIDFDAIRAQGAGGQKVNKASSAVHLRFDIHGSSLPEEIKQRLLDTRDRRITADGVVVIKAQRLRTQDGNRQDALARLAELLGGAASAPTQRKATRPTRSAKRRRVDDKTTRGRLKVLRAPLTRD
jgi:ribosome-associated protein